MERAPLGLGLCLGALASEPGAPTFEEALRRSAKKLCGQDLPEWDPDDNSTVELTQPTPELRPKMMTPDFKCSADTSIQKLAADLKEKERSFIGKARHAAEAKELPCRLAEHQRLQCASASERLREKLQKALDSRDPGPRVLLREELRRAESEVEILTELINCSRNLLQENNKALATPLQGSLPGSRGNSRPSSCSGKVVSPPNSNAPSVNGSPTGDSLLVRECEARMQKAKIGSRAPSEGRLDKVALQAAANISSSNGPARHESLLFRESKQWTNAGPRQRNARRSARVTGPRAASVASLDAPLLWEPEAVARQSRAKENAQNEVEMLPQPQEDTRKEEAEIELQRQEDRGKALEDIRWAIDEATSAVGMKDLCSAQEQLASTIAAAKQNGLLEIELQEAEKLRRSVHNKIEDLKGAIRVFCRVRPLNQKETEQGDRHCCKSIDSLTVLVENYWEKNYFMFDAVFLPGEQEEVFSECRDLIQSAMDGYNVSIFAYGQTSAGKTYTLFGGRGCPGLAPRVIHEVFALAQRESNRFSLTVTASMLELYRNELVDLLSKSQDLEVSAAPKKLNIRTDKQGDVHVENLSEEDCQDAAQLLELLERGNNERTVRATEMNTESSRSHLLLTLKLVSTNRETGDELRGKIQICDLAGSERLKKSMVSGNMAKEAIEINKSLTALGDVIEALTQGQKQIPFRNHKLTQVMQDSLGQSAKTLMFVNCSPANSNVEETLMSLKYAARVKKVTSKSRRASMQ